SRIGFSSDRRPTVTPSGNTAVTNPERSVQAHGPLSHSSASQVFALIVCMVPLAAALMPWTLWSAASIHTERPSHTYGSCAAHSRLTVPYASWRTFGSSDAIARSMASSTTGEANLGKFSDVKSSAIDHDFQNMTASVSGFGHPNSRKRPS